MSETPAKKFNDLLEPLLHLWSVVRISGMAVEIVGRWYNLGIRVQLSDKDLAQPRIETPDPRFLHYTVDYPLSHLHNILEQLTTFASFTLEKNSGGNAVAKILLRPISDTPEKAASNINWYGPTKREPTPEQRKSGVRRSSVTLGAFGEMIHQLLEHDLRIRIDSKLKSAESPYDGIAGLAKHLFSDPNFEQWQQTLMEVVAELPFELRALDERRLRICAPTRSRDGLLKTTSFYEAQTGTKPVRSTLHLADASRVNSGELQWDLPLNWPTASKTAKVTLFYGDQEIQSIHVSSKRTQKDTDRLKPSLDRTNKTKLATQTAVHTPPAKVGRTKEFLIFKTALETYRELGIVGQGGTGIVYKTQTDDGHLFAIKCLDPHKATTQKRKRFKTELHFCTKNIHKNIVTVVDQGIISIKGEDCPFYVMAHYPVTLRDLMNKAIQHDRILPLFSQILNGVEAAHLKRVWHRDLKPENVLYEPSEEALVVADFGIAHFGEEELYTLVETKAHDRLANFQYAAPEQRARDREVDHRADIYSLGLILNEAFTGHVPQGAGYMEIGQINSAFAYLDQIVHKMIQQSPENRPASINEIKRLLIAKGNEFISQQKLDQLRNTVVPASAVTDPFVANPISVTEVDVRGNTLVVTLNQEPPSNWPRIFTNQPVRAYVAGAEPANWKIIKNQAVLAFHPQRLEAEAPLVLNHLKNYIENANSHYVEHLQLLAYQKAAEEARSLREGIAEEERRHRILAKLRE